MFRHGRPPLRFASRRRRGEAPARAESGLVRPFARCRSKGSPDRIQPCDSRAAPRAAGVPSSLSEAPAPTSVRGPAGAGREQLAGGVATEENRGQMEPERERDGGLRPPERASPEQRGASRSGAAGAWGPGASAGFPPAFGPPQPASVFLPHPRPLRSVPPLERVPERGAAPASRSRSPLARPPSAAGSRLTPPARPPAPEGGSAPAVRRARLRLPRGEPGARRRKQLRSGPRSFPARGRPAGPPRGPGAPLRGEPPAPPSGDRSPRRPPPPTREVCPR